MATRKTPTLATESKGVRVTSWHVLHSFISLSPKKYLHKLVQSPVVLESLRVCMDERVCDSILGCLVVHLCGEWIIVPMHSEKRDGFNNQTCCRTG